MSSSIDYGTRAIGALIGVGCQRQFKSAAKVAATTAASLASSAAVAVNAAAAQMYDEEAEKPQSQQPQAGVPNGQNGGTNGH